MANAYEDSLSYQNYLDYHPCLNETYTAADTVAVSNTGDYLLGGAVRVMTCQDMPKDGFLVIFDRAMGRDKAPDPPPRKLRAME